MKIVIEMYDDTGNYIIGKALETACKSLIVNDTCVIQHGQIHTNIAGLTSNDVETSRIEHLIEHDALDDETPITADEYTMQ